MKLSEFMKTDNYVNFLNELDKYLPRKIDRESKIHDAIISLMDRWLQYASVSFEDLHQIISNHQPNLISYIIKKQTTYTEPNGGKDNIINQAPKTNFPISHMIEYYLLSTKPCNLLDYITKTRTPDPKKYSREIEKIFSEIKSSQPK